MLRAGRYICKYLGRGHCIPGESPAMGALCASTWCAMDEPYRKTKIEMQLVVRPRYKNKGMGPKMFVGSGKRDRRIPQKVYSISYE